MARWRSSESNRTKERERNRLWKESNPEKVRKAQRNWKAQNMLRVKEQGRKDHLGRTFGLTMEDYAEMLSRQGGRCAICGSTDPGRGRENFSVDHDRSHCSGKNGCPECVRGLLCVSCNAGLGCFRDNIGSLESALSYLKEWGGRM